MNKVAPASFSIISSSHSVTCHVIQLVKNEQDGLEVTL
jgi:hypothetical protein